MVDVSVKFNQQLRIALSDYEKRNTSQGRAVEAPVRNQVEGFVFNPERNEGRQVVVGSDIKRTPINRTTAIVVSKSPWWAHPPQVASADSVKTPTKQKPRKKNTPMKGAIGETTVVNDFGLTSRNNSAFVSHDGVRGKMVNGEPFFDMDDVRRVICEEIEKMPKEVNPAVKSAQDARKILDDLLHGIGSDMERFRASTTLYLNDIRQTRFAVVTETAQMTKELKEIRQFFLGGDYKDQIERLREFVDLCERLQKLKANGFLDSIADTMLRLA